MEKTQNTESVLVLKSYRLVYSLVNGFLRSGYLHGEWVQFIKNGAVGQGLERNDYKFRLGYMDSGVFQNMQKQMFNG